MRLRYIADNPRGPRGGENDRRYLYGSPNVARRSVIKKDGARGRVLEVDLDDLPDVDAGSDEAHQHAERMMLKWTQRCLETRSAAPRMGPLFDGAATSHGELPAIPELSRDDFRELAEALARWTAWRKHYRMGLAIRELYMEEKLLRDAVESLLAKLGEASR